MMTHCYRASYTPVLRALSHSAETITDITAGSTRSVTFQTTALLLKDGLFERSPREIAIDRTWALAEFVGNLTTWFAVRSAWETGRGDVLDVFARALPLTWGIQQYGGPPGGSSTCEWD